MNLTIVRRAADEIEEVKKWIDEKNTEGAGERWVRNVITDLHARAETGVKHAICQNKQLAKRKYRCFTYNDKWVVAYRITGNDFIICRFIYGAKLV